MAGFDGNGNWTSDLFPIADRDNDIPILASDFNQLIQQNLVASFENCLTVDQQTSIQADFKFNGYKGINLAEGTDPTDAVNFAQLTVVDDKVDANTAAIAGIRYQTGYINGGIVSNDGITPDELIDITAVKCRSSDDTKNIAVDPVSLDITLDASWATVAPILTDASVFVWAVFDETTPYFILDNATGSNIVVEKRRVGAFITDSSGDIIPFIAIGTGETLKTIFKTPVTDATAINASQVLSVPTGIVVTPILTFSGVVTSGGSGETSWSVKSLLLDANAYALRLQRDTNGLSAGSNTMDFIPVDDATIQGTSVGSWSLTLLQTNGYIIERTV